LGVNLFSIIAILSHESYGIWALPSLIFILYLFERSNKRNRIKSFFLALFNLTPALLSFLLCWIFKGDINQSQSIHQSWQALSHILPSTGSLKALEPIGAIAAIGYESSRVYSNTLISQFNLSIFWHPGMWLLTIFLTMRLFIGINQKPNQEAKRFVLCYQLIAFIPMFLFVDIGRWIFMWLSSSALFFSFLENIFGKGLVDPAIFFIGLQPHTLLEKYALENKILKPNYNPMSMMPWTARKLLWNPGSLGKKLGQVCLEAFDNPEDEFGKTVIDILEREYGKSSLKESLKVRPLSERKLAYTK